jgi:hypothetical protein
MTSFIPCEDIDSTSIMMTVAIPPDSSDPSLASVPAMRLNGDYLNSCLHACWMLVDIDYPIPAKPMRVRFVGFSQSVDGADLSPDQQIIVDEVRALPLVITVTALQWLLVVSTTAAEWRARILSSRCKVSEELHTRHHIAQLDKRATTENFVAGAKAETAANGEECSPVSLADRNGLDTGNGYGNSRGATALEHRKPLPGRRVIKASIQRIFVLVATASRRIKSSMVSK